MKYLLEDWLRENPCRSTNSNLQKQKLRISGRRNGHKKLEIHVVKGPYDAIHSGVADIYNDGTAVFLFDGCQYRIGKEQWFRTFGEAVEDLRKRIDGEITSINRELETLKKSKDELLRCRRIPAGRAVIMKT